MGKLMKKKAKKTKGRKPRHEEPISIADFAKAEERVLASINSKIAGDGCLTKKQLERESIGLNPWSDEPMKNACKEINVRDMRVKGERMDVTALGDTYPTHIDIEGSGNLTINDGQSLIIDSEPQDITMRWTNAEPATYMDTEAHPEEQTKEEIMEMAYGSKAKKSKASISEIVEQVTKELSSEIGKSRYVRETAKKFEELGEALHEAVKSSEEEATQIKFNGYNYGYKGGYISEAAPDDPDGFEDDYWDDEEVPEPAEDEFQSDEDYFMRYKYDNHHAPEMEPTNESNHFMKEISQWLGYDEVEELIADAFNVDLDTAFEMQLTQRVIDLTIAKGRAILSSNSHRGNKRGNKGRCESIW